MDLLERIDEKDRNEFLDRTIRSYYQRILTEYRNFLRIRNNPRHLLHEFDENIEAVNLITGYAGTYAEHFRRGYWFNRFRNLQVISMEIANRMIRTALAEMPEVDRKMEG